MHHSLIRATMLSVTDRTGTLFFQTNCNLSMHYNNLHSNKQGLVIVQTIGRKWLQFVQQTVKPKIHNKHNIFRLIKPMSNIYYIQ